MSISEDGTQRNTGTTTRRRTMKQFQFVAMFLIEPMNLEAGNRSAINVSDLAKRQPGILQATELSPDHAGIVPNLHHAIKN
jgi:hypothetical protein